MQFSLRSLLAAAVFAALAIFGFAEAYRTSGFAYLLTLSFFLPECLPVIFLAYALGRRRLIFATVIAFGPCETASLVPAWCRMWGY